MSSLRTARSLAAGSPTCVGWARPRRQIAALLLALTALTSACQGSFGDDYGAMPKPRGPQVYYQRPAAGELVQRFDATGDGIVDVIKYLDEVPSPSDPKVISRKLRRAELDVNGDQQIDIWRAYDEEGLLRTEELDTDFDGIPNVITEFLGGRITRKLEVHGPEKTPHTTHKFLEGQLISVEKDPEGDGVVNEIEVYRDGVLERIGNDTDGDGRMDTWRQR